MVVATGGATIPELGRRSVLIAIKSVHTAAFAIIATSILTVLADGLAARPSRRTGLAAGISLAECAVYVGNGLVCPLTPLAERYGARSGTVTDIFLPGWFARRLPLIGSVVLAMGLALNVRALIRAGGARGRASPPVRRGRRGPSRTRGACRGRPAGGARRRPTT
jgi:hypothetical protein